MNMAEQQIANDVNDSRAQVRRDVEDALHHKSGRQDLEVTAPYLDIINRLKPVQQGESIQVAQTGKTAEESSAEKAAVEANNEKLRQSDAYKREIDEVKKSQTLSYETSKDRAHVIKINGEPDARDNLREGYDALLKHMHDNPALAAQDAAMLRAFQLTSNEAAFKNHLTEDQRDNALAGMLRAHVSGVAPKVAVELNLPQQDGPSR
jgi:hypothetical protein